MSRAVEAASKVFAALGDPTRLRVVARLRREGPLSITQLSEGSMVTRQAITKHLHALSNAGLVRNARNGRERIWELDRISGKWDKAIGRLKAFVEE